MPEIPTYESLPDDAELTPGSLIRWRGEVCGVDTKACRTCRDPTVPVFVKRGGQRVCMVCGDGPRRTDG